MHFGLSEEQTLIVETTRAFVENELYPHEQAVERSGHLPMELIREVQKKAIAAGLYAANMPADLGNVLADTNEMQGDLANTGRLDTIFDNILEDTGTTLPATLGSPAGASMSADVAAVQTTATAIEADTQDIQSRVPAALVSGRMSADAVAISGSTTAADLMQIAAELMTIGTVTGTPSTTSMTTSLAGSGYDNDNFKDRDIYWYGASGLQYQRATIATYTDSTGTFTYSTTTSAPSASDTFIIV